MVSIGAIQDILRERDEDGKRVEYTFNQLRGKLGIAPNNTSLSGQLNDTLRLMRPLDLRMEVSDELNDVVYSLPEGAIETGSLLLQAGVNYAFDAVTEALFDWQGEEKKIDVGVTYPRNAVHPFLIGGSMDRHGWYDVQQDYEHSTGTKNSRKGIVDMKFAVENIDNDTKPNQVSVGIEGTFRRKSKEEDEVPEHAHERYVQKVLNCLLKPNFIASEETEAHVQMLLEEHDRKGIPVSDLTEDVLAQKEAILERTPRTPMFDSTGYYSAWPLSQDPGSKEDTKEYEMFVRKLDDFTKNDFWRIDQELEQLEKNL